VLGCGDSRRCSGTVRLALDSGGPDAMSTAIARVPLGGFLECLTVPGNRGALKRALDHRPPFAIVSVNETSPTKATFYYEEGLSKQPYGTCRSQG
jgi:hypothetical protein